MPKPNRITLALLVLLAFGISPPLVATEEAPDTHVVPMRLENASPVDLGFGTCQWLYPLEKPEETLASEPEYGSDRRVCYAARFGDSKDSIFTLVIDESGGSGTGYDTLYVDGDNDNRIDAKTERFSFRMSTTSRSEPLRIRLMVSAGGKTAPYHVDFTAFPYSGEKHSEEKIHANLRDGSYYVGEARLEGKAVKMAIADLNSNGLFNDTEMDIFEGDRFFIDLDGDGDFREDQGPYSSRGYPYGGATRIGGRWYAVEVSPDGSRLQIRAATPSLGTVRVSPAVASVELRSETQPGLLEFVGGAAPAVAGTYAALSLVLRTTDESGRTWRTEAAFPRKPRPQVTVRAGETTRIAAGPPLRVEPQLSRKAGSEAIEIMLLIRGVGGETYRWQQYDESIPKPGFEIRDEAGKIVHGATFEYG